VGPSDGSGRVRAGEWRSKRGLTWSAAGLYASATEPFDPFAVGLSRHGPSFEPVYHSRRPAHRPGSESSPFDQVCQPSVDRHVEGAASLTGARDSLLGRLGSRRRRREVASTLQRSRMMEARARIRSSRARMAV